MAILAPYVGSVAQLPAKSPHIGQQPARPRRPGATNGWANDGSLTANRFNSWICARTPACGDANPMPDPGWVRQGDVYAVVVTALTGPVGHIVRVVTTVPGTIVLLAAAIALLLTGARDATRRPRPRSRHSPTRPDRTAELAP